MLNDPVAPGDYCARIRVATRWLSEPDDVQDGQAAQGPVHPVGEGHLADGRVAHVLALEVLGVPLAKAPRVGRGGVQDVPRGVFDVLGQGVEDLPAEAEKRTAYGCPVTGVFPAAPPCR